MSSVKDKENPFVSYMRQNSQDVFERIKTAKSQHLRNVKSKQFDADIDVAKHVPPTDTIIHVTCLKLIKSNNNNVTRLDDAIKNRHDFQPLMIPYPRTKKENQEIMENIVNHDNFFGEMEILANNIKKIDKDFLLPEQRGILLKLQSCNYVIMYHYHSLDFLESFFVHLKNTQRFSEIERLDQLENLPKRKSLEESYEQKDD